MANPKKRSTRTRGRLRRTHWKLKLVTLSRCDQCQAVRRRACRTMPAPVAVRTGDEK